MSSFLGPAVAVVRDARRAKWLCFREPAEVCTADRLEDVVPALEAVERKVREEGHWAAGLLSYEAAPAFDPVLQTHPPDGFPLVWFGLYGPPEELAEETFETTPRFRELDWLPSIDRATYDARIASVREQIREGNTYQVNLSYRLRARFDDDPWRLFIQLVRAQPRGYGALVDTGRWCVCSASPELFVFRDGTAIISRPMKGTAPRGLWAEDDRLRAEHLAASPKDRAENVMIVDMVRNDLGRVAEIGSVHVPNLCEPERFPTVWQLTSTVAARTRARFVEVLRATFPPASITGAPKVSTMRIIRDLECSPRRAYTGTVGFLDPHGRTQLNVAIRTVTVDRERREAEYGVGGGVVWDSRAETEFEECAVKARLLTHTAPRFSLLESMLWTPGDGVPRLERHLARLSSSAAYFDMTVDLPSIRRAIDEAVRSLPPRTHKLRLVVPPSGHPLVETDPIELPMPAWTVALARKPVRSDDPFLYHKTTHREVYRRALEARPEGCKDVLLFNERGELTESCIANVVVEHEGRRLTPPVTSGLLPGIGRQHLLEDGWIEEEVIPVDSLDANSTIYLVNAVRGAWRARLTRATYSSL